MKKSKESERRKKRFNLLLTEEEYRFLKNIAELERKTVAEILRSAVEFIYKPRDISRKLEILALIKQKKYIPENFLELRKTFHGKPRDLP